MFLRGLCYLPPSPKLQPPVVPVVAAGEAADMDPLLACYKERCCRLKQEKKYARGNLEKQSTNDQGKPGGEINKLSYDTQMKNNKRSDTA